MAFRINEEWSGFLSYNSRWNLLDESDRHRLELGTTLVWGADNQYTWVHRRRDSAARYGVILTGDGPFKAK